MDIRFQAGSPSEWRAQAAIAFCFADESINDTAPELVDAAPWLSIAPAVRDFHGTEGELAVFYGHPELAIPRVVAVGLGKRELFTLETLRLAAASAMRRCRDLHVDTVAFAVPQLEQLAAAFLSDCAGSENESSGATAVAVNAQRVTEEVICSALLGLYRYDRFRSQKDDKGTDPRWLALLFTGTYVDDAIHAAARRGEAQAHGVAVARDLVNGPANVVTPAFLAEEAQALAKRHRFGVEIFEAEALQAMGMGAFASVFRGAGEAARLIVLEYAPEGTEHDAPIVFVGKGITFDTGGISLKPSAKMHEMKSDMAGAAAILGVFAALGEQDIHRRVIGVLPCTENMPDAHATRPGDVVTSLSGKSIEILNTDAEGRLILCDAMTYAQQRWNPAALIDLATLTGACVVALGTDGAAAFCDDAALSERILTTGHAVGDLYWPMPLWSRYRSKLKSSVADIANVGTREGGAIQAAVFLKDFVEPGVRWAHLDIAGPAFTSECTALCSGGATGFGVRTLFGLVREGV